MEIIGTPAVSKPLFFIAKTSLIICAVFPFLKGFVTTYSISHSLKLFVGLPLFIVGAFLLILSMFNLGESLRVGIPTDETKLKTKGLYAFSRNPLYLGAFMLCAASCIYAPHWINFISAVFVIAIHHRIVLGEEKFLAEKFKNDWISYKTKVRRYL